jgi:D-glycero-alpha-D-manno-heptose-7-phosphate kinase
MIVVQTPLRVSLFGGGTDFADFYSRQGGCVLSSAIDKYIFVIVKERFDDLIRVGYTRTEMVASLDEVQHELVREALRQCGITGGIEVATMADIPSAGSGLGSSSTVTVGLLNALYTYQGLPATAGQLAREACQIEIDVLGKPIGVQDQYIAAYGDLRFLQFQPDGAVLVESVAVDEKVKRGLNERLLLFFTGMTRRSSDVLHEQRANIGRRLGVLAEMKLLALEAKECLTAGDHRPIGPLLHRGWELKKRMASGVSNEKIDQLYHAARQAGAIGGKITGAGGGGFLLLYCPLQCQDDVRLALDGLQELPFALERDGSKVIFNYRR